jgi:hypothetical protein
MCRELHADNYFLPLVISDEKWLLILLKIGFTCFEDAVFGFDF